MDRDGDGGVRVFSGTTAGADRKSCAITVPKTSSGKTSPPVGLAVVLVCVVGSGGASGQEPKRQEPRKLGIVEEVGVRLTLLDVEVTDAKGKPVRGLRTADFAVTLDGRPWPVYSVDDLCACDPDPSADSTAGPAPPAAAPDPGQLPPAAARPPDNSLRYAIYFDFSQLQLDGREAAIREASRWLRETLRPPDQAMVVAYASTPGVKEICPFTSDKDELLRAVDAVSRDPAFVDPWPAFLARRMCECSGYPPSEYCKVDPLKCRPHALDEYFHSRRSLHALRGFLETLRDEPGRKAVLLFNQNGVIQPGRLYRQDALTTNDQTPLLEEIGGVATAARAAVYPAFTGDFVGPNERLTSLAINFGANLADFTGGRHNRGASTLGPFLDAAGRACCVYRVAIEPSQKLRRGVHRVRVEVAGRALSWTYRVVLEDELDQWLRRARSVLRKPAESRALPVRAGLVPSAASGSRWGLRAEVVVEADSLSFLPGSEERRAEWEVGALLHEEESGRRWEMLGISSMHRKGETGHAGFVLHARELDALRPGTYRLAAFVRDRAADLFGGAEAVVTLPRPGSNGVAGPVLMLSAQRHYPAALPPLTRKRGGESRVREAHRGSLPAGTLPVEAGEVIEARTWICPKGGAADPEAPIRYLARDGSPLYRFEAARHEPAGACLEFSDRIETGSLEPGAYFYHFRWRPSD